MTLPATKHDMPRRWSIFAVDPRVAASVTQVLGRDFDVPMESGFATFEISPDEKRCFPCSDGEVVIYDFANGETTKLINVEQKGGKTRMIPTWKSNEEVCFSMSKTSGTSDKQMGAVALWKNGKPNKILSDDWNDDLKAGWLDE
ncbi:MAG: hypothetical protein IPK83_19200 [Planctomycetes bacterium]|nr:hypothetical protein [Planctomycetota bacterium]